MAATQGLPPPVMLDCEHWHWYLFQTHDETLWLDVLRTSRVVSSAMYELIRKVDKQHPDWTSQPDRAWVNNQIGLMLADEAACIAGPAVREFHALDVKIKMD